MRVAVGIRLRRVRYPGAVVRGLLRAVPVVVEGGHRAGRPIALLPRGIHPQAWVGATGRRPGCRYRRIIFSNSLGRDRATRLPRRGSFWVAPFILSVLLAGQGCAARHRASGEAVAGGPGLEGRIAYEVLPDPQAATPALSGQQIFMAPVPLDTPLPEYPQSALAKDAAPVTVTVRIVIHEDGAVHEVLDSPREQRQEGDDREVFRQAVKEVVRSWRYQPATIRTFEEGEDLNQDGRADNTVVTGEKPVRTYLDLLFTFEVVKGRGRVHVGPHQ